MEIYLSIPELEAILQAAREREYARNKFTAALKGIDLDSETGQSAEELFDEVEARAKAKLSGMSQNQYEFGQLGIGVEEE
jgi:hypothetical protein